MPEPHSEKAGRYLIDNPATVATLSPVLLLAHGAGAAMDSPFLSEMAALLAERGVIVARFEFGYMGQRRDGGTRRPPPRTDALCAEFAVMVADIRRRYRKASMFIGGKSMGGRIASMIADDMRKGHRITGCICLGYPFHPVGRPETLRTTHLGTMQTPTLIVQGERDPFGTRAEVQRYTLSNRLSLAWITDGDHDLKPRVSSGRTHAENLIAAAETIATWLQPKIDTAKPRAAQKKRER